MGIGAVLYALLAYVTNFIPMGGASLRPAQAVLTFFGAAFGPVVGFVTGFVGNLVGDLIQGSFWWNWDLGNGLVGFLAGIIWLQRDYLKPGRWKTLDYGSIALWVTVANFFGLYFAALLDVAMGQPWDVAVGAWALPAAVTNSIFCIIFTPVLLAAYRATRPSAPLDLEQ